MDEFLILLRQLISSYLFILYCCVYIEFIYTLETTAPKTGNREKNLRNKKDRPTNMHFYVIEHVTQLQRCINCVKLLRGNQQIQTQRMQKQCIFFCTLVDYFQCTIRFCTLNVHLWNALIIAIYYPRLCDNLACL